MFTRSNNTRIKSTRIFSSLCKRVIGVEKKDTVQNVWEKIAENLDFVENSNFATKSAEAAVDGCSGINSQD